MTCGRRAVPFRLRRYTCLVVGALSRVLSCACFLVRAGPVVRVDCSLRVGEARKSSPCGVKRIGKREKVRPARQKWSVFGDFELAGRVFSRYGLDGGVVGRTFSRREATEVLLGELFRGLGRVGQCRWFYVCAPGGHGGVVGRTFSRGEATGALLGELFRGLGRVGQCRWFYVCAPGRWCAWIARCVLGLREKVRPAG